MDQKLFEQLLTEVSEWHKPLDLSESTASPRSGRPRQREIEDPNFTLPPEIIKLKIKAVDCGDCGRHCEQGRRIDIRLYQNKMGTHYRQRCMACGMVLDPYTGEFTLDTVKGSQKWHSYLREVQFRYRTKESQTDK